MQSLMACSSRPMCHEPRAELSSCLQMCSTNSRACLQKAATATRGPHLQSLPPTLEVRPRLGTVAEECIAVLVSADQLS